MKYWLSITGANNIGSTFDDGGNEDKWSLDEFMYFYVKHYCPF